MPCASFSLCCGALVTGSQWQAMQLPPLITIPDLIKHNCHAKTLRSFLNHFTNSKKFHLTKHMENAKTDQVAFKKKESCTKHICGQDFWGLICSWEMHQGSTAPPPAGLSSFFCPTQVLVTREIFGIFLDEVCIVWLVNGKAHYSWSRW